MLRSAFCFVSGHDFSRAAPAKMVRALAAATVKSTRNSYGKKRRG
jgi:hypothetical protein